MAEQNGIGGGLWCLSRLFGQFRRTVNFEALLTEEVLQAYAADEVETLVKLASGQDLRPERTGDLGEIAKSYHGPALVKLTGGDWILILNTRQISSEERCVILDPSSPGGRKGLMVPCSEVLSKAGGQAVIFRNLQEVDACQQSALFSLCSIARHHNVSMDIRRVMHDYAIDAEEPREALLLEIAREHEFKVRRVKYGWEKLISLRNAYPAMVRKQNGKYAVLCGVRKNEDKEEAVLLDPEHEGAQNKFVFLERSAYESEYSPNLILLKKIYRLADEDRPFSLAWFIPEFMKLKGIFGQIALAVALITLLSLVVPLFFQIVVDKVLVNRAYTTLNILALGIVVAILFNGFLDYVRSYFLLFATNKIDISTATKTFRHLMRLPIEFFERVPSGVLLKHMQQTEKIRGFLSGNLFFTILDVISLFIFIPFLMLYSVELTLVVIGYSVLMACVIACLIKPFQRRLNELYQAEGKRQSMLVESIHGVRTVKSLSLEPVQEKYWDDSTAYAIKSYFKVGKISMTARSISHVLELLMSITVIWLGAHLVFNYQITIGALIAFQMLAGRVTGPLVKMVGLIHEYQQIALSVRMLGVVMNTPKEPEGGGI